MGRYTTSLQLVQWNTGDFEGSFNKEKIKKASLRKPPKKPPEKNKWLGHLREEPDPVKKEDANPESGSP